MKNISFLSENFQFLEVKCSIYLNRRDFVMLTTCDKIREMSVSYTSLKLRQQLYFHHVIC